MILLSVLQHLGRPAWVALHSQMSLQSGPFHFAFAYPFPPWTGIMLLGFGASRIFEHDPARTNAILLRATGLYGDSNPWQWQPAGPTATVIDVLNVTKYPPSLLFVAMTIGPSAILCALARRVPFAFYVAHFFLLHVLSIVLGVLQGFHASQMMTLSFSYPKGYGIDLPGVYHVWANVVVALFPFCRWVSNIKAHRRGWWLSFV